MSNQGQTLRSLPELVGCCSPLVREPLDADQAVELSRIFKAVGDPVRLRLLSLIASHQGGEACVCELTEGFDLTGPTISHHLKVLREAGLISGERRGTWVYYRVEPDALARLSDVLRINPAVREATAEIGIDRAVSYRVHPPEAAPHDGGDAGPFGIGGKLGGRIHRDHRTGAGST